MEYRTLAKWTKWHHTKMEATVMAMELHVHRAALSQQIHNKRARVRWGKVRIVSSRIQLMGELTNGIIQYHWTSRIREGLGQQILVVLITLPQWSRNVGSRIFHAPESNTPSWSCRLNSFYSTRNMSLYGIKSALRLSLMSISPRIRSDRISPYVSTPNFKKMHHIRYELHMYI